MDQFDSTIDLNDFALDDYSDYNISVYDIYDFTNLTNITAIFVATTASEGWLFRQYGYGGYRGDSSETKRQKRDTRRSKRNVCEHVSWPGLAMTLFTPFLFNFFICFITFFKFGKHTYFTFIIALFNFFPQYGKAVLSMSFSIFGISEASKLIQIYYKRKDQKEIQKKQREYDENISLHETFLEAVPAVFITTVMLVLIQSKISICIPNMLSCINK